MMEANSRRDCRGGYMTKNATSKTGEELSIEETFEALQWTPPFSVTVSRWEAGQPVPDQLVLPANIQIQVTGSTGSVR